MTEVDQQFEAAEDPAHFGTIFSYPRFVKT